MPKAKKTKKEPVKKDARKKSAKSSKSAKPAKKSSSKRAAGVKSIAVSAPKNEDAVESRIREIKNTIENQAPTTSKDQLDKLIEAEALKDGGIFSETGRISVPAAESRPTEQDTVSLDKDYQEFEEHIYEGEEEVSPYRRLLLWSSVGVCASVICFGWFLTVAGSLGLNSQDVQKIPDTELQQMTEDMKDEFNNLKNVIRENTEKAEVEDSTIENLVEKIKNSATTTQEVQGEERDIFNSPENAQENQ